VFLLSERFRHITSPLLNAEIFDVLERPALRERIERSSKHLAIEWVTERLDRAEIVEPDRIERVCRDPNDDKLFACAAAGAVDYIVSDDNDVLAVGEYAGARTITTLAFLQVLDELTQQR
jgi:putative PIN family toxin of toxin-antitoxin system